MTDYPLERGQQMLVRPNKFKEFADFGHQVMLLHEVKSTDEGIIAECSYLKEQKEHYISIPFYLLWRIADDEDLLEMHENYIHGKKITSTTIS